jgi:hypothetical protein
MAEKRSNGRECRPGDRGDSKANAGISGIKSGYAGNLKSEASKGYEAVNQGWGGNVRR